MCASQKWYQFPQFLKLIYVHSACALFYSRVIACAWQQKHPVVSVPFICYTLFESSVQRFLIQGLRRKEMELHLILYSFNNNGMIKTLFGFMLKHQNTGLWNRERNVAPYVIYSFSFAFIPHDSYSFPMIHIIHPSGFVFIPYVSYLLLFHIQVIYDNFSFSILALYE